ncbi:MAG: hypothetical protein AAB610_02780 [Patescibacteria group bacterium]
MKKIIVLVVIVAIIGAVAWKFTSSNRGLSNDNQNTSEQDEPKVPTSQTVKISDKLSEYKNDELGFSVKYPTAWERGEAANNVTFSMITDSTKEKNTIGNLQAKIDILSSKCAFPPVTTVKERDVLKVDDRSFNMISIANTVQGRNYFSRMYSLQKDSICYFFTFTSVVLSPTSKGFVGADAQAVGARNTMLVDTADAQFKDMIKSFKFVVGPAGQDETKVSPKK